MQLINIIIEDHFWDERSEAILYIGVGDGGLPVKIIVKDQETVEKLVDILSRSHRFKAGSKTESLKPSGKLIPDKE